MSDEPYTIDYYREINREEEGQANALADILYQLYHPRTVVDLGCATGIYLDPFEVKYEVAVMGVDVSESAFSDEVRMTGRGNLVAGDLRERLELPQRYDLALCIEVLEHIGEEHSDQVVENLCRASNILVVTAAPQGQAGLNHVTQRPKVWWQDKFAKHGFVRDRTDEEIICRYMLNKPVIFWLLSNLMVYKKLP